jgi:outer membrane protein OmpU
MKKILLGTTGLVGAALLATAASAETPKVTLGGFSDFQAGYTSEDQDATRRATGFRNDNEITVKVDGKTGSGLGYGAQIDLEADLNNDGDNQGENSARTFTYLEGSFGRAEMGANKSVAATSRIDASSVAAATGGINGGWTNFANLSGTTGVTMSKLATEHGQFSGTAGDESTYNATKLNYYTPKFSGFQAGVSYTPKLQARGQNAGNGANSDTQGVSDVWDLALGYNGTISGVKLGIAGTYETGKGEGVADTSTGGLANFGTSDVKGWNIGATTGFMGANLAGSYGNIDKTGIATLTDGKYWTLGAGYGMGPVGVSASYIASTLESSGVEKDFSNLVLGADYKLAPGLTPYAEVSFYDTEGTATNKGTAVILGTQVAF